MIIDEKIVWEEIWPVVEKLIEATLAEDAHTIGELVTPGQQAAELLDLFGFPVFDLLLKTVLGRNRLGLARAIEADGGRSVYVEYAWPDPEAGENRFSPTDVVAVRLQPHQGAWRVVEVNPASADEPLTGARARAILAAHKILISQDEGATEPWVLPFALFAGLLQIPLRENAMGDDVERLLLPGLQHRTYGVMSLARGRRLWRDFYAAAQPDLDKPAAWAAAVEFIMNEQDMRDLTQAAVGKHYQVNLTTLVPRVKQIKKSLSIQGLDERYTDLQTTQIIYSDEEVSDNQTT